MLFEAYVAHYNAPRFYIELENRSIPRFLTVINIAFGASCLIYICMASFGFLTFGVNCDGYILNNYSDFDPLANMCRFAIAFSIVFTYPIVFIGFRDGIFDILPINQSQETSRLLNVLTFILLAIVTVFAVFFDNLGMLNAIGGGTIATVSFVSHEGLLSLHLMISLL
jgi:amino acid permease